MKGIKAIILIAGTVALGACASTRLVAPLPDYTEPSAVTLYIQRPPGSIAGLAGTYIKIDGRMIGYIGVGEYWILKLKPGRHGLDTGTGIRGYNWKARSTHCIVVGYSFAQGGYINPAEHCPPPKSWKLAAESASLKSARKP